VRRFEDPYDFLGISDAISVSASDVAVLEKAQSWIQSCRNDHSKCNDHKHRTTPKRLIFVGTNETIRLEENLHNTPYAALSHCWGNSPSCITTKQNISSRMQRVPWAELPKTFQDAIIVTRYMGLHYLWVDSICILQNDRYASVDILFVLRLTIV
jgi:hypothetical protein